ncbi:hypothetical protein tinsulaeT_15770 [Thalassotalea insulae]|uniref:Uncharacterized protein n=1 Tax=Thalassotalea insulae TaxID=2056778 RepID=A0ABQ6GQM5_9GAMM|nr:hypothetical protein [Thalassotalea insulae]GLX78237.1 hypothetical protein tinsulaeT_15770 [Thalassotalea insulae]
MKKIILLFLCFGALAHAAPQADCDQNHLIAHYRIDQHQANQTKTLDQTLVRQDNQLIQLFSGQQYGDMWLKLPNDKLMLTRFFPAEQRAIEYQAEDIKGNLLGSDFWQKKWQLLSPQLLDKMPVSKQTGNGCQLVEHRQWQFQDTSYNLRWLPNQQLIERFEVSDNGQLIESWQLTNIETGSEKVKIFIAPISNYQSTDFADIGDNEADPFFAKMITQGFTQQLIKHTELEQHRH